MPNSARIYLLASDWKLLLKLRDAYHKNEIKEWSVNLFSEVFRTSPEVATKILSGQVLVEVTTNGRIYYHNN